MFLISAAGLSYELIAGSMATYLLGQSITQFSFATGWFLAAMGFGSWLSRYIRRRLLETFIEVQIVLALTGGFSAAVMFFLFAYTETLYPAFFLLALVIGGGIGLEIPLILRLVNEFRIVRLAVADVFTWDYLGALLASVVFPLLILPDMGLIRSAIFFGFLNLFSAWLAWSMLGNRRQALRLGLVSFLLITGFVGADRVTLWIEDRLYQDPIVLAERSPYQRIIVTRWKDDVRLYLDGDLQFSSRDEARYHEALIHIPVHSLPRAPRSALILGGGDGLAVRELLKYPTLNKIILVDLDRVIIDMFRHRQFLRKLNDNSLNSPRLRIVIGDAFRWLRDRKNRDRFDLIIADLPDPDNHSLSRLYTVSFYLAIFRRLNPGGALVTQATSPVYAPDAFWNIHDTVREACRLLHEPNRDCRPRPYHAYIPSFGDWGFILQGPRLLAPGKFRPLSVPVRFLTGALLPSLFLFPADFPPRKRPGPNRLNNQWLVRLYNDSWERWFE